MSANLNTRRWASVSEILSGTRGPQRYAGHGRSKPAVRRGEDLAEKLTTFSISHEPLLRQLQEIASAASLESQSKR
jgi:hypothetical protein